MLVLWEVGIGIFIVCVDCFVSFGFDSFLWRGFMRGYCCYVWFIVVCVLLFFCKWMWWVEWCG